ncbi:MAG: ApbE family protein [Aeromicrobium sp.]|nr:ApbE family protein [Aeromicrobium sp.]
MKDVQAAPSRRYVEHVMGMPITLAMRGWHAADDDGRGAWVAVLQELTEVDRVFSTYRPDSYISRLSRGELTEADCPPEVAEVLRLGQRSEERSLGAFRVWRTGKDGVMRLDTDGIVKGWAVQRASAILRRLPATDFCLSAGGDMVCHTASATGQAWRVGIEDPLDPTRLKATVSIHRGAVATSSFAQRGAHIVDARSGRAPTAVASVTVVSDLLTWADIDATSAFAMGPGAAEWLAEQPGRTGLIVWNDGTTANVGPQGAIAAV